MNSKERPAETAAQQGDAAEVTPSTPTCSNTLVGSSPVESELAADYRSEGYEYHYNRIDAEVTAEDNCEKCGHVMRYIGLKKSDIEEFSGQSQVSYIAISHCDNCGNEYEF